MGMLRQVMHGGATEGQVRLSKVIAEPHVYGIGVPDGLRGEILIAESVAWVAEVRHEGTVQTRRSESDADSAVFLAVARVPRWTKVRVDREVPAEQFDGFVQAAIKRGGLRSLAAVPFVVEGHFASLQLHVLNGQCPYAETQIQAEGTGPPFRKKIPEVQGRLVGFYSDSMAGRLTHHGTKTHVHAMVGSADQPLAGHVDDVILKAGSVLRIPTGFIEP